MYDTINLRLGVEDLNGVNFLEETPCYFDIEGNHNYNGEQVITGTLDNSLRVTVSRRGVRVAGGSFCKWMLGDNLQTLGRKETQQAMERLSDTLHLPFERSEVTKLDIAQNLIMKHAPSVYINHLGACQYYQRFEQPNSAYYRNSKRMLVFYDKVKEVKARREQVPELFNGRHTLRYEMRLKGRLRQQFSTTEVKASLLYDEKFYIDLVNRWHSEYKAIRKVNSTTINFEPVRTRKDLYKAALRQAIEQKGGELAYIEMINDACKRGELTSKQAFDLREAVKDACKGTSGEAVESETLQELDQKMKQAVRFYR